ncbi:zf-HC2 domain-containing protein [Dactylosporangium sp. NPDC049525]|uniref:zf-HC2 domain-containing protein n=1 Tax=Dactylosporangium sp. NPDC049525 TaxID=3154730 RepID=UPI003422D4D2
MKDWLPAYAAGTLPGADRDRVRAHLADCGRCRAELAAWQAIAGAAAPPGAAPDPGRMVRAVLTRSAMEGPARDGRPGRRLRHLAALVVAEARLIRPAVPFASALVLALGVAIVLLQAGTAAGATGAAGLVLALIAPIVAAAGVAGTYRSRRDPAAELVAATPTSARLLLLVRITLVFGCDLALAVAASAVLHAAGAAQAGLQALVGAWLGPMALLSSLSLLIAVRFGPDVALGAAVALWAVRVQAGVLARHEWPARVVVEIWSTNAAVLTVSAAVTVAAVALAGRDGEPRQGWRATHPM